jgi:hypothetical protein
MLRSEAVLQVAGAVVLVRQSELTVRFRELRRPEELERGLHHPIVHELAVDAHDLACFELVADPVDPEALVHFRDAFGWVLS